MVGEFVEGRLVPRALALDAMTNSFTRLIGPIAAGALFQATGLAGAFTLSAFLYVVSALLVAGLRYTQISRRLVLSQVPSDLAEAFAPASLWAALWPVLLGMLLAAILAHWEAVLPRVPEGDIIALGRFVQPAAHACAAAM